MKCLNNKLIYSALLFLLPGLLFNPYQLLSQATFSPGSQKVFEFDENAANQGQIETHLYRRAFTGNVVGTLLGGLTGAAFTKIAGIANDETADGTPEDIDKVIIGIYIGGMVGSALGSSLAIKTGGTKGFGKILLRSFIPHIVSASAGWLFVNLTDGGEGWILGSAFLIGWILTPGQATGAYREYNSMSTPLQWESEQSRANTSYQFQKGQFLFTVRIEL